MKEDLMLKIKNDLAELKHNGADIKEIRMYRNLEMNLVISYIYNGEKHLICDDIIGYEDIIKYEEEK